MPDLLYLGNKLSRHGINPTSVETLGNRLAEDFDIVIGSGFKNPILRLLHMWYLIFRNRNTKYLLIDTYSSKAFWYAITSAWLAKLVNLPYIPILHGGNLPQRISQSSGVLSFFLKNATHVICPSGYLKSEMKTFYLRKYELIPNFLDLEKYPLYDKKVESGVNLLWVRSFHEIYNPCLAIDILALLTKKGLKASLAMIGPDKDGSLDKTKKYAAEKGMLSKVRFTGGLNKAEWIEFSKDYNIFINTTDVDNTPVSVMEAMALGFPVISTNVGGLPYLIECGVDGLLVPPNDALEFVTQIERLVCKPSDFQRIRLRARKVAESWDWLQIKKKWQAVLNPTPK